MCEAGKALTIRRFSIGGTAVTAFFALHLICTGAENLYQDFECSVCGKPECRGWSRQDTPGAPGLDPACNALSIRTIQLMAPVERASWTGPGKISRLPR